MALTLKSDIPHTITSASCWPYRLSFIYTHFSKTKGIQFPYGDYIKIINTEGFLAVELHDDLKRIDKEAYNHIIYVAKLHGAEERIE